MSNYKMVPLTSKIFKKGSELRIDNLTILIGPNISGKSTAIQELNKREYFKVLNITRGRFYEITQESKEVIRDIFKLNSKDKIIDLTSSTGLNYTIPIILELSSNSRNSIAIQDPELGLSEEYIHRLSRYIVSRVKNKNRIVLETKSLQVLHAISIAIIEEEIDNRNVGINLFLRESNTSKTSVKQHTLDKWRQDIPNQHFPFNHTYNDTLKIALEDLNNKDKK